MEEDIEIDEKSEKNEYISFKIVFNNKVILLTYNIFFPEFEKQTVESLIKEVLNKLCPKPVNNSPKDFILHCPCGQILEHQKKLNENLCKHPCLEDFAKISKIKKGGYLLIEKEEMEEEEKDQKLSEEEINQLIKKEFSKKGSQKSKNPIESFQNKSMNSFAISRILINKIKKLKEKEERGQILFTNVKTIYYNEEYYKDLLEMGIDKNKAKAALRITNNNKEEAALISTDDNTHFGDLEFLYYDNEDILTKEKFENLCLREIRKEYPFIESNDEIKIRFNEILNKIKNEEKDENENNSEIEE